MIRLLKKAIEDILSNKFLNALTVVTIALSILIVSAFGLLLMNVGDLINRWQTGVRIMVYLKDAWPADRQLQIKADLLHLEGVSNVRFISKKSGLTYLKQQMKTQSSIFSDLKENPLPDAFEVQLTPVLFQMSEIHQLAKRIEAMQEVSEVEYGQKWFGRFLNIFTLIRLGGYAMGGLFFMAAVFIVANTIRLVLYFKRDEIEIVRLIGATDRFIKGPFFIEGLLQGAMGAVLGLVALYVIFIMISSNVQGYISGSSLDIRFFPVDFIFGIIACSMVVGWIGCYLALRQFLKN
jgi:cell division transport system permease protein